jgi:hypothetical protein
MPPSDLLSALLDLVPAAARKDSMRALRQHDAPATRLAPPLVDTRSTAHALGEPTTTFARLCRKGRASYGHGGDIQRFDVETARSALRPTGRRPGNVPCADPHAGAVAKALDVRRVSREGRHRGTCGRWGHARRRSCLEARRSIGPCNAAAPASCSLQRSARREERMREGGRVRGRDGRRSRRDIWTADAAHISREPNGCEARRSPQPS